MILKTGISRIQDYFLQQKVFAAYLTAGQTGMAHTYDVALALIKGGVNLLEIGVPFSDPVADGPVIQQASEQALHHKVSLEAILNMAQAIRKNSNIPLILFSYLNPLWGALQRGFFWKDAQKAGIDGVLIVDCPLEASGPFRTDALAHGIAPIYVIAPSTSPVRIQAIASAGEGFLYYASRKGTTGIRNHLPADFAQKISLIKSLTRLPLLAGFGISTRKTAQEALNHADGIVIGSLFVKALQDNKNKPLTVLTTLVQQISPLVPADAESVGEIKHEDKQS